MQQWKYFNKAEFVYNGDYNDPELVYMGEVFNYYEIEDQVYAEFKEFVDATGIDNTEENFEAFCLTSQGMIEQLFLEKMQIRG